jgi:hypothetical protein
MEFDSRREGEKIGCRTVVLPTLSGRRCRVWWTAGGAVPSDYFDDDGKPKRTGKKSYSTLRSISSFDVVDLDLLQSALFYRTHIEFCVGVWRRD